MKIHTVKLKKFRSIDNAEVRFSDVTAIVGENNSGKSAIIQALTTFFNYSEEETKNFNSGVHSYTANSKSIITVTFVGIPNDPLLREFKCDNQIVVQFSHTKNGKKPIIKHFKNGRFEESGDNLIDYIKKHIHFVYIPPIRTTTDLQYTETAILRQLVESHLRSETQNKDGFTNKFKDAFNYLQNNALSKLAKKLNRDNNLPNNLGLELAFKSDIHYSEYINDIEVNIIEASQRHNLLNCGTGIQSLTIISLYRLLAKLEDKTIFLALEEPETNLHPHAQREFIDVIKKEAQNSQIALTTHSPSIIDTLGHQDVMLVRKIPDSSRGFKSKISQIPSTFFDDNGLESFKYYQFHLYKNSEFFYARRAIVVESKTDAEIVKVLAHKSGVDLNLIGCSIINLDGVKNLVYPITILKELDIPYLVIVDKDFFLPYINGELSRSKDAHGFPIYGSEYQRRSPIDLIITDPTKKEAIKGLLNNNHSGALDLLEEFNTVSMRYNLETDLLQSRAALSYICDELGLEGEERTATHILNTKKLRKSIKNVGLLMNTVENITASSLPRSYSKIKKAIKNY